MRRILSTSLLRHFTLFGRNPCSRIDLTVRGRSVLALRFCSKTTSDCSDMDLSNMRKKYKGDEECFEESQLVSLDPIKEFGNWFDAATKCPEIGEANAMCIATATKDGRPSARMVLLKGYSHEGFRFFTNYESRKGVELESNPYACLVFTGNHLTDSGEDPLPELLRIFPFSAEEQSDRAVVSRQSTPVPNRDYLRQKNAELEEKYKDTEVPMPDYWGGYMVKPYLIEFWQGQTNRLHDRIVFTKVKEGEEPGSSSMKLREAGCTSDFLHEKYLHGCFI